MGMLPVEEQIFPEGKLKAMTGVHKHHEIWATEPVRVPTLIAA